jgi:ABC-type multidrug transport system ATPase subunit
MLKPFKDRKAGKLSGGMKQKLALSCALIHSPDILVLDEPTTGVDAVSRKEFWEMLDRLKGEGITILVSTPYMDEASQCDRISLIQDGVLMDTGSPGEIIEKYQWPLLAVKSRNMYHLMYDLQDYLPVYSAYRFGEFIHIALQQETAEGEISTYLQQKGHSGIVVKTIEPTIEDCFMDISISS